MITWERKYKRRAGDLASGIGAEDLAFLAYEASKTSGIAVPPVFDDFARKITTLDVIVQEEANPFQPELGAEA